MSKIIKTGDKLSGQYDLLLNSIGQALQHGRDQVAYAVSHTILETYWEIGRNIVEYEQKGVEKAEYGSELLKRLSRDLTIKYGNGFGMSNVNKMRKLYICYPIMQTLSAQLTWSHYVELLKLEDPLERSFYEKECAQERWGVRELKRQMKTCCSSGSRSARTKKPCSEWHRKGRSLNSRRIFLESLTYSSLPVYRSCPFTKRATWKKRSWEI